MTGEHSLVLSGRISLVLSGRINLVLSVDVQQEHGVVQEEGVLRSVYRARVVPPGAPYPVLGTPAAPVPTRSVPSMRTVASVYRRDTLGSGPPGSLGEEV